MLAALAIGVPPPAFAKGETVLVVGAGGRTGKLVVERLVARGYQVRALVRSADKAQGQFPAGVQIVVGDVRNIDTLRPALKSARYVISTVGAGGGPQPEPGNGPEDIDHRGVANLAQAARAARVRHLVLVSSAAVSKHENYPVAFMRPILAAKFKGENALRASGVPYTVIRPGGLIDEPGGRVAVQFAQGDTTTGRIPRADVATVAVEALGRKTALNKTFEIFSSKSSTPNNWNIDFKILGADSKP